MKHDLTFSQMIGSTSFLKLWAPLKASVFILTDDVANLAIYLELSDCVSTFLHLINAFAKLCMLSQQSVLPIEIQESPNSEICQVIRLEFIEEDFILTVSSATLTTYLRERLLCSAEEEVIHYMFSLLKVHIVSWS